MPLSDDQPHTRTRLPVAEQSSYQVSGRQPRPLRTLLAVLVVVTLLVLAISIANRGKPDPGGATGSADRTGGSAGDAVPAPANTAASGQQPVATSANGVANGFPHTDQGAQSAAANYAAALGSAEMFQADPGTPWSPPSPIRPSPRSSRSGWTGPSAPRPSPASDWTPRARPPRG